MGYVCIPPIAGEPVMTTLCYITMLAHNAQSPGPRTHNTRDSARVCRESDLTGDLLTLKERSSNADRVHQALVSATPLNHSPPPIKAVQTATERPQIA